MRAPSAGQQQCEMGENATYADPFFVGLPTPSDRRGRVISELKAVMNVIGISLALASNTSGFRAMEYITAESSARAPTHTAQS
jgi:hypothetical protein